MMLSFECAWIDRTGQTVIVAEGADRVDLLHRLSTNELTGLVAGQGKSTVLLTEKARIIDVLSVLQFDDRSLILGSIGTAAKVIAWLRKYIIMDDVRLRDITAQQEIIEICGPRAADVVRELASSDVGTLAMTHWTALNDSPDVLIVRMPSIAELSYWIMGPKGSLDDIKDALNASSETLPELSSTEAEYLRVASGMGQFGNEWTDQYNPLEAGLLHLTSFSKGCYIGQEVVARLDSYNKVKQRVMGLKGAGLVAPGDDIVVDGAVIGRVTSVVPTMQGSSWLGLGYIRGEHANVGSSVTVLHDNNSVSAVQHLPPMEE